VPRLPQEGPKFFGKPADVLMKDSQAKIAKAMGQTAEKAE
jgi:hypothetical protein